MSKWLAVLFFACALCALAARPGEAKALHRREASPSDLSALRRASALSHIQYLRNADEDEDEHGHEDEDEHGHEADTCIPEKNLTVAFDMVLEEFNITFPENNGTACPAQSQVYSICRDLIGELGLAKVAANCSEEEEEEEEGGQGQRTDSAKAYGYGFLMVLLVSAASLLGVFVVPVKKKLPRVYLYLNALMIAMGVAALFVDAILHLIPHALGLHAHEEEEGGEHAHEEEGEDITFLWKLTALIAGVYGFFMLEMILHSFGGHSHGESSAHNVFDVISDSDSSSVDSVEKTKRKISLDVTVPHGECLDEEGGIIHPGVEEGETEFQSNGQHPMRIESKTSMDALVVNGTSEKIPAKEPVKSEGVLRRLYNFLASIKTIAWFILIGDTVHNFADGLVLGAAISQSLALGLSTMIALIFHEIPHELGDYVILLSSGLTWYYALCFNLFAALTAVIGFFIGVAAGTASEAANEWILAIAAGLFIYIALVDLLPQLIHSKERGWTRFGMIIMANIGFLISFISLLLIAIYEEDLNNLI